MQTGAQENTLLYLNTLRGIAAIYVMAGHSRWLLWEGYHLGFLKHPEAYSYLDTFLVYFFSLFIFGHQAVIFFFVLSGFVIHLRYSHKLSGNVNAPFNYGNYLFRRFRRIYPPLLFALLLTFLLDSTGSHFNYSIYLQETPSPSINKYVEYSPSWKELLGNLLLVNQTYVESWGTNGPLWSLKYEWWFYMLYPLFFYLNRRSIVGAAISVFVLSVFFHSGGYFPVKLISDVLAAMFLWWLGVILADIYTGRIKLDKKYFLLGWLVLPCAFIFRKEIPQSFFDFIYAIGFFELLLTLIIVREHRQASLSLLNRMNFIGDFSYTLYIIHFPVLVFLSGYILKKNGNIIPQHFGYVFCGIMLCLLLAYLLHFLLEKPFIRMGEKRIVSANGK
jgi:peptidoglycan/LPS O-acetylase OafA/YrhL